MQKTSRFNTQPPEGGWAINVAEYLATFIVSTHSHPKVAGSVNINRRQHAVVSTHSHPKVAGIRRFTNAAIAQCFNTQPPEGGWSLITDKKPMQGGFNTQPPEGGWIRYGRCRSHSLCVSTHSHPKVAGGHFVAHETNQTQFQHTATRRWLGHVCMRCNGRY